MKTSIDIPDELLASAQKFSGATTKRDAVVTAMEEYVQRQKMAELVKLSGSVPESAMISAEELIAQRRADQQKLDDLWS